MKTIWKFPLVNGLDGVTAEMPKGARVIRVALVGSMTDPIGHITLWAICDTEAQKELRTFVVKGAGHDIGDDLEYVGTFDEPPFVWHLFEVVK